MGNAIEASGLRKSFGRSRALDGLDLTVRAGEVHAFLGPNGAGKTTTIRILLGVRLHCQVDAAAMDSFMRWLAGFGILSLTSRPPTLEELFLRHYAEPQSAARVSP